MEYFEEYSESDACEDMFMDALKEYYIEKSDGELEWNELTYLEKERWTTEYKEHLFLQECYKDLESFYMTRGL